MYNTRRHANRHMRNDEKYVICGTCNFIQYVCVYLTVKRDEDGNRHHFKAQLLVALAAFIPFMIYCRNHHVANRAIRCVCVPEMACDFIIYFIRNYVQQQQKQGAAEKK